MYCRDKGTYIGIYTHIPVCYILSLECSWPRRGLVCSSCSYLAHIAKFCGSASNTKADSEGKGLLETAIQVTPCAICINFAWLWWSPTWSKFLNFLGEHAPQTPLRCCMVYAHRQLRSTRAAPTTIQYAWPPFFNLDPPLTLASSYTSIFQWPLWRPSVAWSSQVLCWDARGVAEEITSSLWCF